MLSNSRAKLGTRKINGGRKFLEIKVQKPGVLTFVTG